MTDDDHLERRFERWLDDTAEPMPPGALSHVMDAVPTAQRARKPLLPWAPWASRPGSAWRLVPALTTIGLVVVVVVAGSVFRLLPSSGAIDQTPRPGETWDAALDSLANPDHQNPAPDRAGRAGVWRYFAGPSGSHDARRYRLLGYDVTIGGWVGSSSADVLVKPAGSVVFLSPSGGPSGQDAIVAWQSPIRGSVQLVGAIKRADASCETSTSVVTFWIDRGAVTVQLGTVTTTASPFNLTTSVEPGTVLHFVVAGGDNGRCDATELTLSIRPA